MKKHQIDLYIIPHNDAHNSEYLSASDERLQFISNFDGSSGFGLIEQTRCILWTDSRYYIQADKQLQNPWVLKKIEEIQWFQYIIETYSKNTKIGYDPELIDASNAELKEKLFQKHNISFQPIEQNLIDLIWENKPQKPEFPIFQLGEEFQGDSMQQKMNMIKIRVVKCQANYLLTSKLDEIACINLQFQKKQLLNFIFFKKGVLNLRGNDIEFNPLFFSYLVLNFSNELNSGILFIDKKKITLEIQSYLQKNNIEIQSYENIINWLSHFNQKILISKGSLNQKIFKYIKEPHFIDSIDNTIDLIKEVKTVREQNGMEECHIYDGCALVSFLSWLNHEINCNKIVDEYQAAQKSADFRKKQKYNCGLSFPVISSSGSNAAIIHYKPQKNTCSIIDPNQIYLIDSGGQCGTTDVTRTIHIRTPSQEEKDAYTRVLLGNLDIEKLIFPIKNKISGSDIDILARRRLWQNKLDYGHSTGHGVGYYLNVHEGPNGISKNKKQAFQEGNIVSNEPGYYKPGQFGIRIENLILCKKINEDYLGFKNLTLCPYDRNLIDQKICTIDEINYINEYHMRVWKELSPILIKQNEWQAIEWLKINTSPL